MAVSKRHSQLRRGAVLWLPCEVKSGPFPNERRVRVRLGGGEWAGFVDVGELKEGHGESFVRAIVVSISADSVTVGIRGQSPFNHILRTQPDSVLEYGAVPA